MITYIENKAILTNFDGLHLAQTLECGQCFRADKLAESYYKTIAFGKVLYIAHLGNQIEFYPTTQMEFESIWMPYFDLHRNYTTIKRALSTNDPIMQKATEFSHGLRILNQEPWETLISYIISQHNAIPNIKRVVKTLSERYGKPIPMIDKVTEIDYDFPTPEALLNAGLEGIAACKTGFRAKYILDACEKWLNGDIHMDRTCPLTTTDLKENLLQIKGVGNKVADCTLLYGYSRTDCFPIDVWIKRAMEQLYFNGEEMSLKEIQHFAAQKYGNYAGFANIYLFNYRSQLTKI